MYVSSTPGSKLHWASQVPALPGKCRARWDSGASSARSVRHRHTSAVSLGHGDPHQDLHLPDQTQNGLCSYEHRHKVDPGDLFSRYCQVPPSQKGRWTREWNYSNPVQHFPPLTVCPLFALCLFSFQGEAGVGLYGGRVGHTRLWVSVHPRCWHDVLCWQPPQEWVTDFIYSSLHNLYHNVPNCQPYVCLLSTCSVLSD